MRAASTLALASILPSLACASAPSPASFPSGRLVDLTHAFDSDTVYWPTEEGFVLERGSAGTTDSGYWYEAHRFRSAEHGGTHIDAPIHFFEGRWTVDEIPIERLIGEAVVDDVAASCALDRDHQVSEMELRAWESSGRGPWRVGSRIVRGEILVRAEAGRIQMSRQIKSERD